MAPTKKSSSKAPAKKPMFVKKHVVPAPPKSQYELERDERIKRNEKFMLSLGINPHGSGYLKEKKKSKPRLPKKIIIVPESERRRSPRLAGETAGPERLTYDWSDNEGLKRRSQSSRRKRVRVVDKLTDEQRAALEGFNMDAFEAWMEPTLAELEGLRRNCLGG